MAETCCCGREIEETDAEGYDHTDGKGKRCYPGQPDGDPMALYFAEPEG